MLLPLGYENSGILRDDGRVQLPGSSLKGMTRALHEALFNGCMRVIDLDFVPGYRDSARSDRSQEDTDGGSWTLALVTSSDDAGNPTAVRLCQDEVWLDASRLLRAYGRNGLPTTGDVVDFDGQPQALNSLGRIEQEDISNLEVVHRYDGPNDKLDQIEGRVFLVTSVGARHEYRSKRPGEPRKKGRCLWVSGRLGSRVLPVDEDVARDLRSATQGSNDQRRLRQEEDRESNGAWRRRRTLEAVEWWTSTSGPKGKVARRAMHTGFVWPGDVVWVRLREQGKIDRIRLSQLWRHPGAGSVRDRLDGSFHPCNPDSPVGLCLTCAIFGAVDETGVRGRGRQAAYAGHIRFGSARSTGPVQLKHVQLAPMGTPNPGSGMFYLRNDRQPSANRSRGDRATEWGSEADAQPRPIAGRKFYWHANPDTQARHWSAENGLTVPPRYEAVGKQRQGKMVRTGSLVPAGTRFTTRIAFDGLDEISLLTLLWSIDPAPLLRLPPGRRETTFAVHLGGGKPLGLGSATVTLGEVSMACLADRYGNPQPPAAAQTDHGAPQSHVARLVARVGRFTQNLEPLARLLDLQGLGDDESLVNYPPARGWNEAGTEAFRESFKFFQVADGEVLENSVEPWHPLPALTPTGDMTLPIDPRRKSR